MATKGYRDAFVGLHAQHNHIRLYVIVRSARKERLRSSLEMYRHFRPGAGQTLSGSHVKGHTGPSPIFNAKFNCCVSVDQGAGRHSGLFAVAGNVLAVHFSGAAIDRAPFAF
ncbi:MAG: hypothetical protein WKF84_19545 [Pyrinomonadaceae bacterium]